MNTVDIDAILNEVDSWPVREQFQLAQVLWERLADSGLETELTEQQKAELDRRLDDLEANPDDVIPWEQVQEELRRSR